MDAIPRSRTTTRTRIPPSPDLGPASCGCPRNTTLGQPFWGYPLHATLIQAFWGCPRSFTLGQPFWGYLLHTTLRQAFYGCPQSFTLKQVFGGMHTSAAVPCCFLPVMGLCCTATYSERTQKHRKTSVQTIPMPKSKVDQTKNIGSLSSALTRCTDSGIWSPKDLDTENTSFSRCFSLLPASELRLNCFSDVILREKADPLLHGHIARLPSAGLR